MRACFKGDWSHLPARYLEILAYAEKRGLSLTGYSYEMGINETVTDRIEDYIVQIEIPVGQPQTANMPLERRQTL